MAARDHFPTLTTAQVLELFNQALKREANGQTIISSSSADVSTTKLNVMSPLRCKLYLWETLCAKDSDNYTWPPDFLPRNRTVAQFRHRFDT